MARLIRYGKNFYRFHIEDETWNTWRIKDRKTGKTVQGAMQHYEASLEVERLNLQGGLDDGDDAAGEGT